MKDKVHRPGDWYGIHNKTKGESVVYHWSTETDIGKKYVISHAFELAKEKKKPEIVPLFDLYKVSFFHCDHYNQTLHGKTWPHKRGGNKRSGTLGAQHDYMLSCILINTVSAYWDLLGNPHKDLDFRATYLALADELFFDSI